MVRARDPGLCLTSGVWLVGEGTIHNYNMISPLFLHSKERERDPENRIKKFASMASSHKWADIQIAQISHSESHRTALPVNSSSADGVTPRAMEPANHHEDIPL